MFEYLMKNGLISSSFFGMVKQAGSGT